MRRSRNAARSWGRRTVTAAETVALRPARAERGKAIVAFLGCQALGDFVYDNLYAAVVARKWPECELALVYRNDRPYKDLLARLNPYATYVVRAPGDARAPIPLDWFDGEGVRSPADDAEWQVRGFHAPDLFLVSSMTPRTNIREYVDSPPALRLPEEEAGTLAEALAGHGLDRDRWFVCVHMRETGYAFRSGEDARRSVDPVTYVPMIRRVIEEGGQVVRLGDPSMTPLPEIDGLIDLAAERDSFAEQVFATSRARFFIGTESGPCVLASTLKVPTAVTNAVEHGAWNAGDVTLTKRMVNFIEGSARVVRHKELFAVRHLETPSSRFEDNTPEEISAVAEHMVRETRDCPGWREDVTEETPCVGGPILFPPRRSEKTDVLWWD